MANLELYKIFIMVAKEQNITKASEKLNISQPAVTKHIKNLENELNTVLFIRDRGMKLTEKGRQLYEKVMPAVEIIVDAEKQISDNINIKFGTYATMLSKVLSDAIADFYKMSEKSKITVVTEPFDELPQKLFNHELDMIVVKKMKESEYDNSKIKYIKLGTSEFKVIANNKSDLCGRKVKIEDLKNKIIYVPRAVTSEVMGMFEKNGMSNQIKKIDSITMSNIIQKHDDCVGLMKVNYAKEELEEQYSKRTVPILGELDTKKVSLPIISMIIGFVDGT